MDVGGTKIIAGFRTGGGVSSINGITGAVILAAGTNVTITPAGQTITIAAIPAGSNTQVQFNDNGVFGGAVGLTYIKASQDTNLTNALGNKIQTDSGSGNNDAIISTGVGATLFAVSVGGANATVRLISQGNVTITSSNSTTAILVANILKFQIIAASAILTVPLIFLGSTSGSATIGVAAVAGTPNRINWPIATGAAGTFLQTDGGNPQQTSWVSAGTVIANGTATLNVAAIPAVTAATVVTVAAAGVLATDSIAWAFNAAPGTGYTTGLHVLVYVTAGNVNFLVVNPTAGALTPAAATLNWRVIR